MTLIQSLLYTGSSPVTLNPTSLTLDVDKGTFPKDFPTRPRRRPQNGDNYLLLLRLCLRLSPPLTDSGLL